MVQGLSVPVQFGETEVNTINCGTPAPNSDNEVLLCVVYTVRLSVVEESLLLVLVIL
jgi:hypothetical protein